MTARPKAPPKVIIPTSLYVPQLAGYVYVGGVVEGKPNPRYTVPIGKGERRLPEKWHKYTLTPQARKRTKKGRP